MAKKLYSFTLIELLITVSIGVMLLALGARLFTGQASKEQAVEADSRILASFIERARNFAANPESEEAIGYRVSFIDANSMEILRIERGGTAALANGSQKIALANSRLQTPFPNSLDFNVYRDEGSGDITQDRTLTLRLNRDTQTAQVRISKTGAVSVCTPIQPGATTYQCG